MINDSINSLKYIGKETSLKLNKLHVHKIKDLLYTFPKKYEDYIVDNSNSIIVATIKTSPKTTSFRISKTTFNIDVKGKTYLAIAYRQPYLNAFLNIDDQVIIKASFDKNKNVYIVEKIRAIKKLDDIEAQYQLPDVQDYIIRKAIKNMFDTNEHSVLIHDYDNVVKSKNYMTLHEALKAVHVPKDYDSLARGWRSLKLFDAIKFLQSVNKKQVKISREPLEIEHQWMDEIENYIPFHLTDDQRKAIDTLIKDMKNNLAFEYLIQGDVGSGKTIVAFIVAIMYIKNGYQVAIMAPTEILASQHYESFNQLFNVPNVLLTGSSKEKSAIKKMIKNNETSLIFGTHALTSADVTFNRLGVVIIDEQHKFGVKTRQALVKKSMTKDLMYLTATPIPRSLMHVLYGNAEVLNIQSMPKGRQKITTLSVHNQSFIDVVEQLKKAVSLHQHVFVVVPSIASNRSSHNILSTFHVLKPIFENNLFVIHGQMRQEEQEHSMQTFKQNQGGILLATSMIEVGVNIPTATFMVILDANYFGLSQLHQLRGRIGRGTLKGVCYLLSDDPNNERLKQLENIQDGFKLSELDLQLRGPGKLFGTLQSGNFKEGLIHIIDDLPILKDAKDILSMAS